MTPAQLSRAVLRSVRRAVEADGLRVRIPERVAVRRPPRPGCGDYATNVALQLAAASGSDGPRALEIAEALRRRLTRSPGISRVDVAAPGFLNITLDAAWQPGVVRTVLARGEAYGRGDGLVGTRVRIAAGRGVGPRAALHAQVVASLVRACGGEVVGDVGDVADVGEGEGVEPAWPRGGAAGEAGSSGVLGAAARSTPHGTAPAVPLGAEPRVREVDLDGDALLRLLGADASRWALLATPAHEAPRLDPGRLLSQREANPLFRVQYAYTRTRALARNACELGVTGGPGGSDDGHAAARRADAPEPDAPEADAPEPDAPEADAARYAHPAETALVSRLADHPGVLESAARHRAPDRLARHLDATADAFLALHAACPVLPRGDEEPSATHRARLELAEATGTVLAGGLRLLGIAAPARI